MRSRFNPTPVERLQQIQFAKAALKIKACHVHEGSIAPVVSLTGYTGSMYDFSMLEARINDQMMMASLKYGTMTTSSAASTELTYASIKETMEQIAKFDAPKRILRDYLTMDFVIPPIAARPNAMPVSNPYYDPPMATSQIEDAQKPPERVCSPSGTGYGKWKFDHRTVKERAERLAKDLPAIMEQLGADHIVVHGTSGTMIAPVLLYLMPGLKVIMIRKSGEGSHGNRIEGPYGNFLRGLMVDDFIASGGTLREVIKRHDCEVVGILCHSNADPLAKLREECSNGVAKFYYV